MSLDDILHGQFIHFETYAKTASKKAQQLVNAAAAAAGKKPHRVLNSAEVIAEALRDVGACGHVKVPQPPTFWVGDEKRMRGLLAELDGYADDYQAKHGKTLRKDTPHLLAGTASYPKTADPARYEDWRTRTIAQLKVEHGSGLVCVLEHTDENNKHIHFYVIDPEVVNVRKRAHPGHVAKAKGDDYKDAMRAYQDRHHASVSAFSGLLRIGPNRGRFDRDDYMSIKADAEQRRVMLLDIEAQSDKANTALQQASRTGLEAQQMGATMLQKAKQRAKVIEATAQAQAQINKDEARRLHEEKQRLQEWADQLKMSAEKIAKNTGHMVEIVVPGAPSAPAPKPSFDSAAGHKRPEAAPLWTGSMPGPG